MRCFAIGRRSGAPVDRELMGDPIPVADYTLQPVARVVGCSNFAKKRK